MVRDEQRARAHVVAVDLAAGDLATLHLAGAGEPFDEVERVDRGVGELAAERAVAAGQLAGSELQLGQHHPAVAGARAGTERPGLERDDRAPAGGELPCRGRAAVPRPDDDDVRAPGQLGFVGRVAGAARRRRRATAAPRGTRRRAGRPGSGSGGRARADRTVLAADGPMGFAVEGGRFPGFRDSDRLATDGFPCAAATHGGKLTAWRRSGRSPASPSTTPTRHSSSCSRATAGSRTRSSRPKSASPRPRCASGCSA